MVSAASLLAAGLMTACGTQTTDFVFVASAKAAGSNNYGVIDVFEINSVSGYMRQIPTSPFPSGGRNPVAEAVASDNQSLYVVNQDDNDIVQFKIGTDGKLYPQNTVNTPGMYPLAVAVNGSNLFVVDTYQPLTTCSTAAPCSGSVGVFPVEAASSSNVDGALGTAVANGSKSYWPLCQYGYKSSTDFTQCKTGATSDVITPTAINVLESGAYAYVTAYDTSVTPNVGYVFGFSVGSSGALTPLNGGVPFAAGVHPSAIASDSSSSYVYVTDSTKGNVYAYSVSSGLLSELIGSPISVGNQPSAIVADTKYPYLYVANAVDGTVSAYSITSADSISAGKPPLNFIATYTTGTQPVAIGIDPSTYHFLFVANFNPGETYGTVSNFELNTDTGTLVSTQHSPYASNAQPTAVAAIPHKTK